MKDTISRFEGHYLGILERHGWEYATRTNARAVVVIIPVTDQGELVLVEQFRIPVNGPVMELPAGLVGDEEDAHELLETAAHRELLEETGFRAGTLTHVLTCPSTAGLSDEMITIFLAKGLEKTGSGGGTDSENILVHLVALEEAGEWLTACSARGVLLDPKIYAALYWLGDLERARPDPCSTPA